MGTDALAHLWPHALLYTFPLLTLIQMMLGRVCTERHNIILVAPHWPKVMVLSPDLSLAGGALSIDQISHLLSYNYKRFKLFQTFGACKVV